MEIPKEVKFTIEELKKAGFEAYIVGGCVRDFLRGIEPEDWDVTTRCQARRNSKNISKEFL